MSLDDWERLSPREMLDFIDVWEAKQRREHQRLEAIDMMAAQIAWACVAPYQGKGKQSRIEDWRVFRKAQEAPQKTPEQSMAEKQQGQVERAKLAHAALRRARARKQKRKAE